MLLNPNKHRHNIAHKLLPALLFLTNNPPQLSRLDIIPVRDLARKRDDSARPLFVRRDLVARNKIYLSELGAHVVWVAAVVAVDGARPVAVIG